MTINVSELVTGLKQICDKRDIDESVVIDAISKALAAAYKKSMGMKGQIVRANIDLDTGSVKFEQVKTVVPDDFVDSEEFDSDKHITLSNAKKIKSDVDVGNEIVFELENYNEDFGRIAAQTARQVILQKLKSAEKEKTILKYSDKIGTIVGGVIQKIHGGNIYVDLDNSVGIISRQDSVPSEKYMVGQRIRALLYDVGETEMGVTLKLTRSSAEFVKKLFEMESPEVSMGIVEIKEIAREAGSRTKIAVYSNDDTIDAVGACVGQSGSRVQAVRSELRGEKLDIVLWSPDPAEFIANALSPAIVNAVEIDESTKTAVVYVDERQLSLAIGVDGQNVRLAVKLTGYAIDIKEGNPVSDEEDEEMAE